MSKISRHAEIVAYHEAGHAVVAHMLGAEVRRVVVNEDGGGRTSIKRLGRGERAIVVNLAGPYAQKHHAPRSHWRGVHHTGFKSGYDFDNVTDLIFAMHGKGKVADAYWRYVEARAEALVEQHWKKIDAVAKALLKQGTISGDIREFFPQVFHPRQL